MNAEKLVVAVKVDGRVLREVGDSVFLPFGREYSILIKNLDSVRIQTTVDVDGRDAVGKIVVDPNSSVELERFVRDGNLRAGNRFKFVERTAAVERHRGVGAEDGLIRVESRRERVRQFIPQYPFPRPPWDDRQFRPGWPTRSASVMMKSSEAGITVPGGVSNQQFRPVSAFDLEWSAVVVVLHLRGEAQGATPVTVKTRVRCETCGLASRAGTPFCRCGTSLTIV